MDIATVIGLMTGMLLILWGMSGSGEGDVRSFIDLRSAAIVLGGSLAAALTSFPIRNLLSVAKVVKNCFLNEARDPSDLVADLVRYARLARRDGILALENVTAEINDPFLVSGFQMAVDGTDPELIEAVMMDELEAVEARHAEGKALFDNLGKYAPAFGMIGTLIGLVLMLKNMNDPKTIGPAMAVALITTFYGAMIANLFALPLAEKLAVRSREESFRRLIVIKGVIAIQSGDNPRVVEQKLRTFLPSRSRMSRETARAA